METIVNIGNQYVWEFPEKLPWLVVVLLAAGFYITLRLLFVQLRHLKHGILVVLGRFDDPDDPGDVNHFQALSTALSATVGIGNIAGVATAIHYGGPGAVFWMWVTAFFGMALKFAECTLSMEYRVFDENGDSAGGPMYYIERGLGRAWKPLAVFFAFCAVIASFGGGNMNQANTVAVSAHTDFGVSAWIVGALLVVVVGAVILGGIRSIARVASALAPSMAAVYVLAALVILAMNAGEIGGAFGTILENAFNPKAGFGGSVAGSLSVTLLWGVKRGLFSNEAGQGSAPIAHAAAKTNEPVREGVVAMLGPMIDTLIICTMTALVIVVTGVWDQKTDDTLPLSKASVSTAAEVERWRADNPEKKHVYADELAAPDEAIEVAVEGGKQDTFVFVYRNGIVDEVVLLVDDEPFTGTLAWDPDDGLTAEKPAADVGPDEDREVDLTITGKSLQNASELTSWAFDEGLAPLGDWGNYVVTLCVFLFAVSTMISWSYYGDRCVTYLFGVKYVIIYRVVFLAFVYVGATTALEVVWDYGDLALGLMAVPNLLAVVLLSPKIVELSRDYFTRMREKNDKRRE